MAISNSFSGKATSVKINVNSHQRECSNELCVKKTEEDSEYILVLSEHIKMNKIK
jgi:hypothetical protein